MLTKNLRKIISDCCDDFQNVKNNAIIVPNSVPVLWFGDIDAYRESKRKIVTVALNPSNQEFCQNGGPYSTKIRFGGLTMPYSEQNYYDAMNNYFNDNPYCRWFSSVERMLNKLDASYGGKVAARVRKGNTSDLYENTAVHIDIKAPVATDPTWGKLSVGDKKNLKMFEPYYDRLIDELKPDIIMISVNKDIIKDKFINAKDNRCTDENCDVCYPGPNTIPFIRGYILKDHKVLITGYNYRGTAFGGLSDNERKEGMKSIIALLP